MLRSLGRDALDTLQADLAHLGSAGRNREPTSRGQRQTGTPATCGRARHRRDALVSCSLERPMAWCKLPVPALAGLGLLQTFYRHLGTRHDTGRSRRVASGPSSGAIITSLGGVTLCSSRHTSQLSLCVGCSHKNQPVGRQLNLRHCRHTYIHRSFTAEAPRL